MESTDVPVSGSAPSVSLGEDRALSGTARHGGGEAPPVPAPEPVPEGMESLDAGVCAPAGYRAAGLHCGIKHRRPDLAVLLSDPPATAAGLFTTNRVQAAPVRHARSALAAGRPVRAIVVNSGNANACTGARGERDVRQMAAVAAEALDAGSGAVLVCSTGLIGVPLPMDALRRGIPEAVAAARTAGGDDGSRARGGRDAARAILTTDRFPKTAALRVALPGGPVTVGGMAKGAGMIHPRLATTLAFLTTDAHVPASVLRGSLAEAAATSFNAITVDGETSTNDALLALANGRSGVGAEEGPARERLAAALGWVSRRLSGMVVADGEGATKVACFRVEGARSEREARRVAFRLANSLLVKTALHGGEPNWGRLMAAAGSADAALDEGATAIWFGDVQAVRAGVAVPGSEAGAAAALAGPEVHVRMHLGVGDATFEAWTCDLTEEYVRINGSYAS